jgi:hypothetical protein
MKSRAAGAFVLPGTSRASDRIKSYGRGRVCEVWGCNTILSAYNPALFCSAHDPVGRRGPRR